MLVVRACTRDGRGGSPTAILDDDPGLDDAGRRSVAVRAGTSHAVFLRPGPVLRFFTAAGELPACGHGTVAALAVLAARRPDGRAQVTLRAGNRVFAGRAAALGGGRYAAAFDPGPVTLRPPGDTGPVLAALGLAAAGLAGAPCVASVGRERLLVPVPDRAALAALAPDARRLKAACDAAGLLGCYVYTAPDAGRAAARMFAPAIGVPEDIANANSTACLAAYLGPGDLAVDMGDALGEPATVTATARQTGEGLTVEVGGAATVP